MFENCFPYLILSVAFPTSSRSRFLVIHFHSITRAPQCVYHHTIKVEQTSTEQQQQQHPDHIIRVEGKMFFFQQLEHIGLLAGGEGERELWREAFVPLIQSDVMNKWIRWRSGRLSSGNNNKKKLWGSRECEKMQSLERDTRKCQDTQLCLAEAFPLSAHYSGCVCCCRVSDSETWVSSVCKLHD